MTRLRMLAMTVFASLAVGVLAVPAANAANGTASAPKVTKIRPLTTVTGVTGKAANGRTFTGRYQIQQFVTRKFKGKRQVLAYGTLVGKVGNRKVTRYGVVMPATLTGASGARTAQLPNGCTVLHLVLAPIQLNLLGLVVTVGGGQQANLPVVVDITAVPGGGLLGDLLCNLTNALNGGPLAGLLGQVNTQLGALQNTLTGLLGLVGGTVPATTP